MKLTDIMQGIWQCSHEPILEPGAGNAWDNLSVITPAIFAKAADDKYEMFYVGLSQTSGSWGIGYAESKDLLLWEKHNSNPLIRYEDKNNYYSFDSPCLVRKGNKYHLFCEEKRFKKQLRAKVKYLLPVNVRNCLKSLRLSSKGMGNLPLSVRHAKERYFVKFVSNNLFEWNVHQREVFFQKDTGGQFDSQGLFSPQVHEFDEKYYMFYGGSDGKTTSTGLAVSNNLVSWNRSELSPVLKPGKKHEWDQNNALIVSILKLEDGYCGFYEGEDANHTYRIGLAYSYDLKQWEKFERNPIIQTGGKGTFSERMACSPHIFMDKGRIYLFYTGHGRYMHGCCGVARFEEN